MTDRSIPDREFARTEKKKAERRRALARIRVLRSRGPLPFSVYVGLTTVIPLWIILFLIEFLGFDRWRVSRFVSGLIFMVLSWVIVSTFFWIAFQPRWLKVVRQSSISTARQTEGQLVTIIGLGLILGGFLFMFGGMHREFEFRTSIPWIAMLEISGVVISAWGLIRTTGACRAIKEWKELWWLDRFANFWLFWIAFFVCVAVIAAIGGVAIYAGSKGRIEVIFP